jgi:nucleoside-diphosphate-sugar epimerase
MTCDRILIVGASGVLGSAMVERFAARPDTEVHAVSRRRPDVEAAFGFASVDLEDADACAAAVAAMPPITHAVYAAVTETEGLVGGWSDRAMMRRNLDMMANILGPVVRVPDFRHLVVMQGTKAYGAHLHAVAIPARESPPRDAHENFYWLHEDWVRDQATSAGWGWTIFRPQVVLGGATGVVMNPVIAIGLLAAIAAEEEAPLRYPGRHGNIHEAVDARLVASACDWAFGAAAARGEIFNLTNGDVWVLRDAWPRLAAMLGLAPAIGGPYDVVDWLLSKEPVWQRIVERHGLRQASLSELLGQSHHYLNLLLAADEAPPQPILVSTIKVRQAGFHDCFDSFDSLTYWLGRLVDRRILPPLGSLVPSEARSLEAQDTV